MRSIYTPPPHDGVPNPLGPRLHNWAGGKYNEGSLFHGPVYVRPGYKLPRRRRPLRGVGEYEAAVPAEDANSAEVLPQEDFVRASELPSAPVLSEVVEEEDKSNVGLVLPVGLLIAGVLWMAMASEKTR